MAGCLPETADTTERQIRRMPFPSPDDDRFHEECGLFGIFDHEGAAALTALGLHALQHRGQEAAGIVSCDGEHFHTHRALGLVGDHFSSEAVIGQLAGNMSIGHVRYSTAGEMLLRNVQPLFADFRFGGLAVAHNGNLTNAHTVHKALVDRGCIFQSTSDTETIIHLIAISKYNKVVDRITDALQQMQGAYSLVALTRRKLIGVRDPHGVRPLALGQLGSSWIITSETCALDIIGADFVREIEPGEIVVIDENGVQSLRPFQAARRRFCIFEHIYFARPDSVMDGQAVHDARKRIGSELAKESHVDADIVVPVPDSGVPSAIGYAEQSGIPFDLGIIRNHYVGRTFIEPTAQIRNLGVRLKHNANAAAIRGKRVVLVDDSIVRGTTSVKIVDMVRQAGVAEIHMRIASPPTKHPCFYGIDTPQEAELLASTHDAAAMARRIGVDSLAFISIDGLYRAVGVADGRQGEERTYCDACFTGEYPIPLTDHQSGENAQMTLLVERD